MFGMKEKILIIDDNIDAADILKIAMLAMGHETKIAYNGAAALKMIRDFVPDVVLCDINMPHIQGYEVCMKMHEDPRLARTLFIAQTGLDSDRAKELTALAGFKYHLVKPVDINQLLEIITLDHFAKEQQRQAS